MIIAWFLLFNCDMGTSELESTNLSFHIDKPYKTEITCLKAASKGAIKAPKSLGCYFVCVKGYEGVLK